MSVALNPIEYKREEEKAKTIANNNLRSNAKALNLARLHRANLKTWRPRDRTGTEIDVERQAMLGRTVAEIISFFDNQSSNALEVLAEDSFRIVYQMYYDIDRQAVLGMNTMTTNVPVTWQKLPVNILTYTGPLETASPSDKFTTASREGIPNRDEVAKSTGWNRDEVRRLDDTHIRTLKVLMEQARVGQSKLTRLVKAYLWLLEVMERGTVDVLVDANAVVYNATNVIAQFRQAGQAYVYNSKPDSDMHTALLQRMCEAYPPPEFASHVTIPADGERIVMIVEALLPRKVQVRLTPASIHASILTYAMDASISSLLQPALLIACSLHQNRYFSSMKLPRVASIYDLMVPAYVTKHEELNKPIITEELAKSLGRIHQMMAFAITRDIISAAEMTTSSGFDPTNTIISYLKSATATITRMAEFMGPLGILEATKQLQIFQWVSPDDIADMTSVSIMESLWLAVSAEKVVHNGVIASILDGSHDMTGDLTTYDILRQEIAMAGVTLENEKLPPPRGAFTVGWVGMEAKEKIRPLRNRSKKTIAIKLVQDCDFKPMTKVKRVLKQRIPPGKITRSSAIPKIRTLSTETKNSTVSSNPPEYKSTRSYSSTTDGQAVIIDDGDSAIESRPPTPITKEEFRPTRIAQEAMRKTRVSFKGLQDFIDKEEQEYIASVAQRNKEQLSEEEQVNMILKEGKLNSRERGEWLGLIGTAMNFRQAVALGNFERIYSTLLTAKLDGCKIISGNSKYTKALNEAIERWNPDIVSSEFGRARSLKGSWFGSFEKLPNSAYKFIANSKQWEEELESNAVDPEQKLPSGTDRKMTLPAKNVIATMITLNPKLNNSHCELINRWLLDSTLNVMPTDIEPDDLRLYPDNLRWRHEPSSLGERERNIEDSRWLILAAESPRRNFDIDILKRLCKDFDVPREMRGQLKQKYSLFEKN